MIRLMIVDDHEPTRKKAILELQAEGVIQVVAEAETSDDCFKIAQQLLPDIVLLDLHLPGLITSFDLLKKLTALPRVKVIMYASDTKAAAVQDLLDAGASAYILKTDPSALVRMSILMVAKGGRDIVSSSLPRHLTRLMPVERAILRRITKRGKIPAIAEELSMKEEALEQMLNHLTSKFELKDTTELVKWAKKHGF